MTGELIEFLVRWGHVLFGIVWIGMLYYFNFVQGGYFKEASPEALADAKAKLAPSALWWFRWGAMFTFITGLYLLHVVTGKSQLNNYIIVGAVMGTLMFINVWAVIWPAQKIHWVWLRAATKLLQAPRHCWPHVQMSCSLPLCCWACLPVLTMWVKATAQQLAALA